ncbi:hypothetical protein [Mucilaginibacter arboris]|uniref:Lipoprotein n=1 Tax=Mucilaginibacter arboris TaxID=2682090 RepID=A0A7K1T138_9SPHI|nr:hypothetical protein [Mucilaginibacter arboris]MVN23010.1 hypothetical protein [Mucilaginibacter arboris]
MKEFTIGALIVLCFLCSCNGTSTGIIKKPNSLTIADSIKKTDTPKFHKKPIHKNKNEDQTDMDIMNNILKKKKSIK